MRRNSIASANTFVTGTNEEGKAHAIKKTVFRLHMGQIAAYLALRTTLIISNRIADFSPIKMQIVSVSSRWPTMKT